MRLTGWIERVAAGTGIGLACLLLAHGANAADPVQMVLKDHHFTPNAVTVPTGERFRIEVTNQDAVPAEFESYDMKFEKIMVPGAKISVFAGPLRPGTYKFFDDYHPDQATGTITAAAPGAAQATGPGTTPGTTKE